MKKLEMYTIYSIVGGDLNDRELSEKDLCDREISLQSNNLLRKYIAYKGFEEKDQFLEGIIKLAIPVFETVEETVEFLKNGITFNKKRFIPLVSSPSMMKKEGLEDDYYDEEFKTEYLYIVEDEKDFVDTFEDITSLGKLTVKRKNKEEIAINKDVIARLSLSTSSSYPINYKPNIIVLPSTTYEYTAKYCFFEDGDYSKLKRAEKTIEHEYQDGCGLMSPKLANIIQKELKIDYPVDFVGVRADLGLAIKGLLVKVDFNAYWDEIYKEKTTYFEKREDGYYTLDYYGATVNISKADMIVTPNMAKWAGWWKQDSQVNIMEVIDQELSEEKYDKYRNILSTFSVTTINKKQPKEYSLTNYQLISNLALLPNELKTLQQETYDMYNRVLDMDIKSIKLMMQDIAKDENDTELGSMDKIHYMLQSTEDALLIPTVKKQIVKMVRKKIDLLAQGRFFVKGNYKIASTCPITFMDYIMFRDPKKCNQGLGVGEFYIPQETGKRVMSRNPLNSFSEIAKFTIAKNDLVEKYCGNLTSEIIFFNQKDDRAMLNSGEDYDTDRNLVIDNEIIYNAVIEPKDGYNFYNVNNNKDTKYHEFTKENEYLCVCKASGNLIGKISNIGIRICTSSTELGYYRPEKDSTCSYKQLKDFIYEQQEQWFNDNINEIKQLKNASNTYDMYEELLKYERDESRIYEYECEKRDSLREFWRLKKIVDDKKKERFEEVLKEKYVSKGILVPMESMPEDEQLRQLIIKQFYKNKKLSYNALELQMLAIDVPKTLKTVDNELITALKKASPETKEPNFKKYVIPWAERQKMKWSKTHSVLNLHSMDLAKDLMAKAVHINEEVKELAKSDRTTCTNNILSKAEKTKFTEEATNLFKSIFNGWLKTEERLRAEYKDNKTKMNEELRKNNLITSKAIMELTKKYDLNTCASALLETSKSSKSAKRTQFIIGCCFNIIQQLLDIYYNDITKFIPDENGINHWLFKDYTEIKTVRKKVDLQAEEILKEQIKQKEIIVLKFRPVDLEKKVISRKDDKFFINNEPIFNNDVVKKDKIKTYDLLNKVFDDKTELEVDFKDIDPKETYTIAYLEV